MTHNAASSGKNGKTNFNLKPFLKHQAVNSHLQSWKYPCIVASTSELYQLQIKLNPVLGNWKQQQSQAPECNRIILDTLGIHSCQLHKHSQWKVYKGKKKPNAFIIVHQAQVLYTSTTVEVIIYKSIIKYPKTLTLHTSSSEFKFVA